MKTMPLLPLLIALRVCAALEAAGDGLYHIYRDPEPSPKGTDMVLLVGTILTTGRDGGAVFRFTTNGWEQLGVIDARTLWPPGSLAPTNAPQTNLLEAVEITRITRPCDRPGCSGSMRDVGLVTAVVCSKDGLNTSEYLDFVWDYRHEIPFTNRSARATLYTNVFIVSPEFHPPPPILHHCTACTNMAWFFERFPRLQTNRVPQ